MGGPLGVTGEAGPVSLDAGAAWSAVVGSPLLGLTLTLAAYVVAQRAWQRSGGHPLLNPVLVAVALIGTVLWLAGIDYAAYRKGGDLIGFLLGPATVALAWPLHQELALVRRAAVPVLGSVVVGSGVAVAAAVLVTTGLGGDRELALSMAPKSTTAPVSIALSQTIGGIPALTAVLTIIAGILGGVAGPRLLSWMRVRDPRVRGLAVGTASHGIGTARMLVEDRTAGAFSGLAMALTALATSVWIPVLLPLLT